MNTATRRKKDRMRMYLEAVRDGDLETETYGSTCDSCGRQWFAVVLNGFGPVDGDRCPTCHPHPRSLRSRAADPATHPGVDGAEWYPWIGLRGQWRIPLAVPLRRVAWGRVAAPEASRSYATKVLLRLLVGRLWYRGGRKARRALIRLRAEIRHRPDAYLMLSDEAAQELRRTG